MIENQQLHFGGYRLSEDTISIEKMDQLVSDVTIIGISWEDRSLDLLKHKKVRGKSCILVNFHGDKIPNERIDTFISEAQTIFERCEHISLSGILSGDLLMSETEDLARKIVNMSPSSCAIDYSCLPKAVTQTLFRKFMIEGKCPIVRWIYLSGLYDTTKVISEGFNQGLKEFTSIRGAEGNGGIGSQKIAILALGADQPLIDAFLREQNYAETYFVYAFSKFSPSLMSKVEEQRRWLQQEHGVSNSEFVQCEASSVLDTLRVFIDILKNYPSDTGTSVDIFCSGPKSHAVAASALVTSFKNVCLLGRIPLKYTQFNVTATGEVSISTISDYTNPYISTALVEQQLNSSKKIKS